MLEQSSCQIDEFFFYDDLMILCDGLNIYIIKKLLHLFCKLYKAYNIYIYHI